MHRKDSTLELGIEEYVAAVILEAAKNECHKITNIGGRENGIQPARENPNKKQKLITIYPSVKDLVRIFSKVQSINNLLRVLV